MSRRALLILAAAAALAGCNKGSSRTGFGLAQPSSLAVARAYGHLHVDLWPYGFVSNSAKDELVLFDAVEDKSVPAPILLRALSIPVPDPRPALVASADFRRPDGEERDRPSLLVAVSSGATQLQLIRTWKDPRVVAEDPGLADEAPVELGSAVLALVAVPTTPDRARVVAALADGNLAVVDYQWMGGTADPATPSAENRVARVTDPVTRSLDFAPLSLAVDPTESPPRFLYAASLDPVQGATYGVARFDMTGDLAAWPFSAIDAGAPTRLVAALTLRERKPDASGTYDQIADDDGEQDAGFVPGAVKRVYAWRDPGSCGPATELACGIVVLDPEAGGLARPGFLALQPGEDPLPIAVPSRPIALLAGKPPVNPPSDAPRETTEFMGIRAVSSRVTTGVLGIPCENGRVYWADLGRWEIPSAEIEVNSLPTATRVSTLTPSSTAARRIGFYLPARIVGTSTDLAPWSPSSQAANYIQTTPGFTPTDTWTVTYQGYLPDFVTSRTADVEAAVGDFDGDGQPDTGRLRVAFQAHSPGISEPVQVLNVYDPARGVRVGDIVEIWTGPTQEDPSPDVKGSICPDTTEDDADGLPTPPVEGKVVAVAPPDAGHAGGSLVIAPGDCVRYQDGMTTKEDCAEHGPWTSKGNCWGSLPTLQGSERGSYQVRIRAGGGSAGAEEFVVVGAVTGYAGRAVASAVDAPSVPTPSFVLTSVALPEYGRPGEVELAVACAPACSTGACPRDACEQLAIARRARRTHYTSVRCRDNTSDGRTFCRTYHPEFVRPEGVADFPPPKGPTLAFSLGLGCAEDEPTCTRTVPTDRLLVRDGRVVFTTRSGWTPSSRYGGGGNGGPGTQPTGGVYFDRTARIEWDRLHGRGRFLVPYVDNLVLDATASQTNGDTRVLR